MRISSLLSLVAVVSVSAPLLAQECRLDYGQAGLNELRLSDNYRLTYLGYGSGEPVVLIHGHTAARRAAAELQRSTPQ